VDPLAHSPGTTGFWYSKPRKDADGDEVILAGRGETPDHKRAVLHKDGSANIATFTLPSDR
jgi:hypothetical protein